MRLYRDKAQPELSFDLERSFGPFLVMRTESEEDLCLLDGRSRDPGDENQTWLGYNAGPLFGVAQFEQSWTNDLSLESLPPFALQKRGSDEGAVCGSVRRYVTDSMCEQFEESVHRLDEQATTLAKRLEESTIVQQARYSNWGLQIEFQEPETAKRFHDGRFEAGLLFDLNVEKRRVRVQLCLAYRERELTILDQRLKWLLDAAEDSGNAELEEVAIESPVDLTAKYDFHRRLIQAKLSRATDGSVKTRAVEFIHNHLSSKPSLNQLEIVVLTAENYAHFRDKILAMQQLVYEPARQTPPAEFDLLFESENPLAIVLVDDDRIVAMSFAGRLGLFTDERGVSDDPYLNDPTAYYSMDLTVVPDYRGGLGRMMKCALSLLAIEKGVSSIHGRNRDRLAASMWAINLSLGSYELARLKDDYPDQGPYRDCIYYRCPLEWNSNPPLDFERVSARIASVINGPVQHLLT